MAGTSWEGKNMERPVEFLAGPAVVPRSAAGGDDLLGPVWVWVKVKKLGTLNFSVHCLDVDDVCFREKNNIYQYQLFIFWGAQL